MEKKVLTSVRLTPECRGLLTALATKLGLVNTHVIELAIREMAKEEGIQPGDAPSPDFGLVAWHRYPQAKE